jgi:hypothetical protein
MRSDQFQKILRSSALLLIVGLTSDQIVHAQDAAATATQAPASGVMSDAQIEANVLKALAGSSQLADQNISTTTVYGVVTLSGSVRDEATRSLAETIASRAAGVKKVVGEMTLVSDAAMTTPPQGISQPNDQSQDASSSPDPNYTGTAPSPNQSNSQRPVYSQPSNSQPSNPPVARQSPMSPNNAGPYDRRQNGPPPSNYPQGQQPYGAQQAGLPVVVPSGAMLRIRINQGLDSKHSEPGNTFDGVVLNDVVADGSVAIPRGASIQGTVVDSKPSGALKGKGELVLQLTQVTLAGRVFPVVSDKWSSIGPDKTGQTVGSAIGLGAFGALIGAVAGGGPGAAIGAGAGAVAGLGASAASGTRQALIPPEAILTFHFAQPASLVTVSQAEMDRLGYGVPTGSQPQMIRRPRPAYYGSYGPGYYARPYPAGYPYPY